MSFSLKFLGVVVLAAIAPALTCQFAFPAMAKADAVDQASAYQGTSDAFERAFYRNDTNFFQNRSPKRQLDAILGTGSLRHNSFTENEIKRDAELVEIVYRDGLRQQVSNDPYIRTPDLPNPYSSSLLNSPRLNINKLSVGTEFQLETMPPK
ncbi:MAG: hypothetical protein H0X31_13750 [Nostocaceae cyanobacterium]|nr:hypothetical protein [Nostocaceae cyanobacterium]